MGSILLPLSRSSQGERNMDIYIYIYIYSAIVATDLIWCYHCFGWYLLSNLVLNLLLENVEACKQIKYLACSSHLIFWWRSVQLSSFLTTRYACWKNQFASWDGFSHSKSLTLRLVQKCRKHLCVMVYLCMIHTSFVPIMEL